MEVNELTQSNPIQSSTANGAEALSQLSDDYTTFLRLLTAQISNQDPLEPIDSTTFVTQLAQLTQVEQAAQTNANLATLSAQLDGLALTSGANLVGREANIMSSVMTLDDAGARATYMTGATAANVTAEIYGPSGQLIHTLENLPGAVGTEHDLTWSGVTASGQRALTGTYSVVFSATDDSGTAVPVEMYRTAIIQEVHLSGGQVRYLMDGDEHVALDALRSVN